MKDNSPFQGIQAIDDSGGIQYFAREVMAEVKRCVCDRIREGDLMDTMSAVRAATADECTKVISRRLKHDIERMTAEAMDREIDQRELNGNPSVAEIRRRALESAVKRVGQIVSAVFSQ